MSEKQKFIEALCQKSSSMTDLCREFDISRTTGYYWKKRYQNDGNFGLKKRSSKPISSPKKTSISIEQLCVEIRLENPRWGGSKIRRHLFNKGQKDMPSEKTINRIIKRYGLITAEESEKHKAFKRFEHENPNDLWQMDFKGDVKVGNEVCYPLTILDDHSRYALCLKVCMDHCTETVKHALIEVFKEHGVPKRMTMDNGPPWGYSKRQQHTKLCAWLIQLGITISHSRPGHPQTQGKLERMHRTLKSELLTLYTFEDFKELQQGFDDWRKCYNEVRPHGALNNDCPVHHYKKSERQYEGPIEKISYDETYVVRKVQHDGEISLNGKLYLVGSAFHGHPIGLKPSEMKGLMEVYFCHQKVAVIDLNSPIS